MKYKFHPDALEEYREAAIWEKYPHHSGAIAHHLRMIASSVDFSLVLGAKSGCPRIDSGRTKPALLDVAVDHLATTRTRKDAAAVRNY